MEVDEVNSGNAPPNGSVNPRIRAPPGGRALNWIVSKQCRTTKPAVCRGCHSYFDENDERVCTVGDRAKSRWVHVDCISGGLKPGMVFSPDKPLDAASARILNGRVAHETVTGNIANDSAGFNLGAIGPGHTVSGELSPPSEDAPLPAQSWFQNLSWNDMRSFRGQTFVQVPRRLESAFAEAMGVAIREIRSNPADTDRCLAAWKAFRVLPWLLMLRPADQEATDESCATLLTERLDRFWQGDVLGL